MKTQPTADMLARHPMEFWEAVDYFQANRKKLAEKYDDQFVAILDRKVVDNDTHMGTLGDRMRKAFPNRDPYMPYVSAKSLEQIFEGYETEGEVDWKRIREEGEAAAADELIRRMDENMKFNLNG